MIRYAGIEAERVAGSWEEIPLFKKLIGIVPIEPAKMAGYPIGSAQLITGEHWSCGGAQMIHLVRGSFILHDGTTLDLTDGVYLLQTGAINTSPSD